MNSRESGVIAGSGSVSTAPLFAVELRRLRTTLGLGQRELGRRTQCSGSYVCSIEAGRVPPPSHEAVLRLAEALQLNEQATERFARLADEARTCERPSASGQAGFRSKELKVVLETAAELAAHGGVTIQVFARGMEIKVLPMAAQRETKD